MYPEEDPLPSTASTPTSPPDPNEGATSWIYWARWGLNNLVTGVEGWESIVFDVLRAYQIGILHSPDPKCLYDFFYWRWPMPDPRYADRQAAYELQIELLDERKWGPQVVIFDGDLKLGLADKETLERGGGRWFVPALLAPDEYRLLYPSIKSNRPLSGRLFPLAYVGNNYERYEQTKRLIGSQKADLWGNWMEPGPGRADPSVVQSDLSGSTFHGRIAQDAVVSTLAASAWTIHLAKPEYCSTGFVTYRWAEAAQAGCPAMIPAEFAPSLDLPFPRVESEADVRSIVRMPDSAREDWLGKQREWVSDNMVRSAWKDVFTP